jgi:rhomboid protease GluP
MVIVQGSFKSSIGPLGPGAIDSSVAFEFGALTARSVAAGQVWRTITATFIHLSLLHLICNLTCLVAFGRLLNYWYGGPQFFAIYLLIAALGNGFAVAGRYIFKASLDNPCAGGSSVMFGLIALIAVVGWRSKTRFGDYVRRQMVGKLVFFGLIMGIVGRNILDNYGHAGGALAGALVGFSHKQLIQLWDRRAARWTALVISTLVVASCVWFQWKAGRTQYVARQTQELAKKAMALRLQADAINVINLRYDQMISIITQAKGPFKTNPLIPYRREIENHLRFLSSFAEAGVPGNDGVLYGVWMALAQAAVKQQPTSDEMREFRRLAVRLRVAIRAELKQLPTVTIKPVVTSPNRR